MKPVSNLTLFSALTFLVFTSCHQPLYVQQHTDRNYAIDTTLSTDSNLVKMLQPYKTGVDTQMLVVIGRTDIPLTKAQPECTIGNFMADAQMVAAQKLDKKVVGSVINYGGIRLAYIAPGSITRGEMYELMPFDNMLTIVEVPGKVLRQFCSHMAKYKGWPVSGIHYTIRDKEATDITVDGDPLNDQLVYKIAMSDYIARGGDNCDFLSPLKKRYTSVFVRDAMIEYVQALSQENKPLHPEIESRIRYAE
jgi:2',3'-cyclic-nucleotide 2'-phosphodiesterase (5'-nucleotidase family)